MNLLPRYGAQTSEYHLQNIASSVKERGRRRKINKETHKNRDKYTKSISNDIFLLRFEFQQKISLFEFVVIYQITGYYNREEVSPSKGTTSGKLYFDYFEYNSRSL